MRRVVQSQWRQMGHGGEFWQKVVHWRREWQTTPVFLPQEPHKQYEKAKRYDKGRLVPQVCRYPICHSEQRNSSRKNKEAGPKWKWRSFVDVSGGESKVQCYKEQYCVGTWNVRSMNRGKLDMVKQEMARVNIYILGIRELKWMGMDQITIISTTCRFLWARIP